MSDGRTKVGVIQITSTGDVEANLEATERCVGMAADDGAQLVLVPECFAYLGREAGKLDVAEPLPAGGPILARMKRLASDRGVEVVLGGFWEKGDDPKKVRNACIHLDATGEIRSIYRKIHLFDVDLPDGTRLMESETVEPGDEAVVSEAPFGTLGLSVCYDLRFPELYRRLVDRGAVALAVPAAFTLSTGKDHWHVLLRARAIESQAYVLAAAQTGHHYGRRVSYGHALIADPWGTVLAECGDGEGAAVAWVDPAVVERVRRGLPSLRHRVLDAG
ncbi:MAG TPA: carbon-nitrogen hydrolase family protein [Sandaracinaceae bacterium LLY-WYZ-13_1]|nr:carbon-nitrogen hydrolase family protein [Sandaracinaceae bacterium LLY-WYZ-13_1]